MELTIHVKMSIILTHVRLLRKMEPKGERKPAPAAGHHYTTEEVFH